MPAGRLADDEAISGCLPSFRRRERCGGSPDENSSGNTDTDDRKRKGGHTLGAFLQDWSRRWHDIAITLIDPLGTFRDGSELGAVVGANT